MRRLLPTSSAASDKHVDTIQGYGISNLVIANSIFYGCPGQCIIFRPYAGGIPARSRSGTRSSTSLQDPGQAVYIGSSTSRDGDRCNGPIVIENNTFVNGADVHGGCWNNPTVIFRNNIMSGSACNFGGSGDSYTNNVFSSGGTCGANAKRCTPRFVSPTSSRTQAGNFHLAPEDTCAKGLRPERPSVERHRRASAPAGLRGRRRRRRDQVASRPDPASSGGRFEVPKVGIEPTLPGGNRILSPARLPVPPLRPAPAS